MMIRTQLLLPSDLLHELRLAAFMEKTSVSGLVRRILSDTIGKKRNKKKLSGVEVLQLMAKYAYRGKAPRDLSTNDEYLYGKDAP